jgi:hypothetical protein
MPTEDVADLVRHMAAFTGSPMPSAAPTFSPALACPRCRDAEALCGLRIYADGTCRVSGPITGQRPHALDMAELSCNLTCVHNTQIGTSRSVALAGAALRQADLRAYRNPLSGYAPRKRSHPRKHPPGSSRARPAGTKWAYCHPLRSRVATNRRPRAVKRKCPVTL